MRPPAHARAQFRSGRATPFALLALTALVSVSPSPSRSGELDPFDDMDRVGAYEVWAGVDAARRTWLAYSGVTVAPWGDTHADGFRLRATSAVGQYRYEYSKDQLGHATRVAVDKVSADIAIGYQTGFDALTVKGFLGWAVLAREFTVSPGGGRSSQVDQGVKAAVELWLDWSEVNWASLDASYAGTRDTVDMRLRLAQRLESDVSAGLEAILNRTDLSGETIELPGNHTYGNLRLGAFIRYDWFGGEASVSGGLSADVIGRRSKGVSLAEEISPYGAVTVLFQF